MGGVRYLALAVRRVEDAKANVMALGAEFPGERAALLLDVQFDLVGIYVHVCTHTHVSLLTATVPQRL
jgi:hypothetical protein